MERFIANSLLFLLLGGCAYGTMIFPILGIILVPVGLLCLFILLLNGFANLESFLNRAPIDF